MAVRHFLNINESREKSNRVAILHPKCARGNFSYKIPKKRFLVPLGFNFVTYVSSNLFSLAKSDEIKETLNINTIENFYDGLQKVLRRMKK